MFRKRVGSGGFGVSVPCWNCGAHTSINLETVPLRDFHPESEESDLQSDPQVPETSQEKRRSRERKGLLPRQ